MKRSEINRACREAKACFESGGWALPPQPRWDVTDLGLGRFAEVGLVLVNLAEEAEYCEKLMYARRRQVTPLHTHARKKEDIICRRGRLAMELWADHPARTSRGEVVRVKKTGEWIEVGSGEVFVLEAGERVTLTPGIFHSFWPESDGCIIGEVSTANDDVNDNIFADEGMGRFPEIE
ncbi:MAG TPA: D-lyxose/D-mannose family sugar isomerase, partial [Verrucomicrobiaceae bacterium]